MNSAIAPVRTVAPADTPVSLLEAREHLRLTGHEEDTLVAALISAAVSHLDGWSGILGRCLVEQTWRQDMPEFPDAIRLPLPDVQSVTVTYTDVDDTTQTLSAADYHLVNRVGGAWIEPADGVSWPSTATKPDAVKVTMVCGYGAPAAVPSDIKRAILLHVGHLFNNREAVGSNTLAELDLAYKALIDPYRRIRL